MDAVQTTLGKVRGKIKDHCREWFGIPFAKAPLGELAYRHPQPPEAWDGVCDATHPSANPVQANGKHSLKNSDRDCLYLNVFAPENEQSPLPVMVWFYGGSYKEGGAGAPEPGSEETVCDLSFFAEQTNTVVVTFNYRLNLYGFLNLHAADPSCDMNNGLYDQLLALRFIRDNIAAFGGDPDNVTLFGQSAGAACILALMSMPEAEGLFHKAIIQSACTEHFFPEKESRRYTKRYLKFAGKKTPEQLDKLTVGEIQRINKKYASSFMKRGDVRCAFSPVIDGGTLKEEPVKAASRSKIPILIGTVAEEGNIFAASIPDHALFLAKLWFRMRPRKDGVSYRAKLSGGLTDQLYVHPMLKLLDAYQGTAWRYEYQYTAAGNTIGCYHASELPVLFGQDRDPDSICVGRTMRGIWSRFAYTGTCEWAPYQKGGAPHLITKQEE